MAKESRLLAKARKKAISLNIDVSAVLSLDLTGSFPEHSELNLVEYTLHEAAHYLTLGRRLDRLKPGSDVTGWVTEKFNILPKLSADALEMDTSYITHLAGLKLKLWSDPSPIILSTGRNLRQVGSAAELQAKLEQLFQESPTREHETLVSHLVRWWRAR